MVLNLIFELSMTVDTDSFQETLSIVCNKSNQVREVEDGYIDLSMASMGITVIYRDSRYKKKVRMLVNTSLIVDDVSDTDKLIRKLNKRIVGYFDYKYGLDDFTLSGVDLVLDINVGTRANVSDYLKVLQRVGKVKGFSPISYDCFENKASFCLSGNSNDIDFLLYDLERTVVRQLRSADVGRNELQSASERAKGILRAEVRLTKPKAIRAYTDAEDTTGQIMGLAEKCQNMFLDTFTRIVPFGSFYKRYKAIEIVWQEVKDSVVKRKMLRLLTLIPEKKSLHLAQKAMNCRNIEKVMDAFAKINLSPVTISKRQEIKHLENLYSYFL